jgi:ribonuclease HII
LTEKKREKLYDIIMKNFYVAVGVSTVEEIDKLNILNADFLAMRRALKDLENLKKDKKYMVLVDGNLKIKEYKGKQLPIVKGDAKSLSIAAASIIAKVTRDRLMKDLASIYPDYHFEKHKGYGTKAHIEVIKDKGAIEGVHRKVFLKKILNKVDEIKKEQLTLLG